MAVQACGTTRFRSQETSVYAQIHARVCFIENRGREEHYVLVTEWLGQNRRLSKDYGRLPKSTEAFICAAMGRLMARRLAR